MSFLQTYHYENEYDSLTGLANRKAILHHLDVNPPQALAIINIDAFDEINDLYGQKFGDKVLKAVAFFLHHNLDMDHYKLYKLPGDEFAITTYKDKDSFYTMLLKLIFRLDNYKFKVDSHTLHLRVTGGVSCAHGTHMLEQAKLALKWARKSKKPLMYMHNTPTPEHFINKHHEMLDHLKYALEYDKVYPVFQPICCNVSSEIVKYEALMRITTKDGETLMPQQFLGFSKKARLYPQLTKRMIKKALHTFQGRLEKVAINVSIEDILSTDVSTYLFDEIDAFKEPERIIIEITETEGIDNYDIVCDFVQQLKKRKVQIALDDFGSGYSNFMNLLDLNADIIKIDGSIIQRITDDVKSIILTKTILGMAKEMNMRVVAEFVSNKKISDILKHIGVHESQGYYIGKPQTL